MSQAAPKAHQNRSSGSAARVWAPIWRRIPLIPTAISAAVVLTGGIAVQPVRDAATLGDVAETHLVRPLGYIAIAPVSDVLDTLTLLSAREHIALLIGVFALFALSRVWRGVRGATTPRQHVAAFAVLLLGVVVTYAAAAFMPRPMASLVTDNANIIRVDFHGHTTASHDGHQGVEELRDWHRRAGYDVAYVTDHNAVSAAEQGMANNPSPAGTGVTLLQGIEVSWSGEHVAIPGAERNYRGLFTANLASVDTQGLQLASLVSGREPVVIWNHPHQLDRLKPAAGPGTAGIRAIEIVNGAPQDIDSVRIKRQQIVEFARRANIALTAGSDNHGFGSATPGWTLLLIVGWRGASSDALALEIDKLLRERGFWATKVVERRVADPGASTAALALSVITVPARMLTTLSINERLAWLAWTWLITALSRAMRRRRTRATV